MNSKKILIIEDESGLILTLTDRLEKEGYTICSETDGIAGEGKAASEYFDCIILDIMLPGRDGYQICRNLRDKGIKTPVLMLTARSTNLDTVLGLRLGADDYLAKPFDMTVLIARIEALIRRSITKVNLNTDDELCFGDFILDSKHKTLTCRGENITLSVQEYRMLEFLIKHPDRVISRDQLLDEVWGYESMTTTRTVDVHISSLRKKMGESDHPKHIYTVRGFGYQFKTEGK